MSCEFLFTANNQRWSGSYVTGSYCAIVVKYHGATNSRGSRWIATLKRDSVTTWRATVTFNDGPLYAAAKIVNDRNLNWQLLNCATIDPDTYVISVG
jgi:hypothetical protein